MFCDARLATQCNAPTLAFRSGSENGRFPLTRTTNSNFDCAANSPHQFRLYANPDHPLVNYQLGRLTAMHTRKAPIVLLAAVIALGGCASPATKHAYKPVSGYVPDEQTAIKIAVAVWEPIYGAAQIAEEKPYRARLDSRGVWIVEGSLPKYTPGGVAIAEIARDDGRILRVSHDK